MTRKIIFEQKLENEFKRFIEKNYKGNWHEIEIHNIYFLAQKIKLYTVRFYSKKNIGKKINRISVYYFIVCNRDRDVIDNYLKKQYNLIDKKEHISDKLLGPAKTIEFYNYFNFGYKKREKKKLLTSFCNFQDGKNKFKFLTNFFSTYEKIIEKDNQLKKSIQEKENKRERAEKKQLKKSIELDRKEDKENKENRIKYNGKTYMKPKEFLENTQEILKAYKYFENQFFNYIKDEKLEECPSVERINFTFVVLGALNSKYEVTLNINLYTILGLNGITEFRYFAIMGKAGYTKGDEILALSLFNNYPYLVIDLEKDYAETYKLKQYEYSIYDLSCYNMRRRINLQRIDEKIDFVLRILEIYIDQANRFLVPYGFWLCEAFIR